MPTFTSKVEELKAAKELRFEPTLGFGDWKQFFPAEAVAHPAKINLRFLEYLITHYTQEGHLILDPMSGTCSTGVVSALHGRDAICVELEDKFVTWGRKAIQNVESSQSLMPKGKVNVIQGDARNLSSLCNGRIDDSTITSIPFGVANTGGGIAVKGYEGKFGKDERLQERHDHPLSENPDNISNLKDHGNIDNFLVDSVELSPPYSNVANQDSRGGTISPHMQGLISKLSGIPVKEFAHDKEKFLEAWKIARSKIPLSYGKNPHQIGNLSHGSIDDVILSPPYSDSISATGGPVTIKGQNGISSRNAREYSPNEQNIGNLRSGEIDGIVTSPPYEQSEAFQDSDFMKRIADDQDDKRRAGINNGHPSSAPLMLRYKAGAHVSQGHSTSENAEVRYLKKVEEGRVTHHDSIGKLEKESYLQAMFRVYTEMYSVLKPGGRAIIVIKPFVRNKSVVDLPWQTWLLLQKAGFQFEDVVKLYLKNLSFWRILQAKKYPDVPVIRHEWAIIVRKPVP